MSREMEAVLMFKRFVFSVVCLITLAGVLPGAPAQAAPAAATVPSGFVDELVTSVPQPTALASTPDGRVLIALKSGQLVVRKNGTNITALDISGRVCADGEQGLLGIEVDPAFSSNGYIYAYYTVRDSANGGRCVNRVSRFTMSGDGVVSGSETVLIYRTPYQDATNHNAGDLHFGKDGKLYISVGDGGCDHNGTSGCAGNNDAARDTNTLLGKILRINRDGTVPSDNPYIGTNSGRCNVDGRTDKTWCQETFAWGLRNPFRFAMSPNHSGTVFHINDVGQNLWEEIDLARKGADYGWNRCEGRYYNGTSTDCDNLSRGMQDPVYNYSHNTGCSSITGGAFVPNGLWPTSYNWSYMYADYVCGKIFQLYVQNGVYKSSVFASGLGNSSAVHLAFGPYGSTQALYYTTYEGGGSVRRIRYTGSDNRAPVARIAASPGYGSLPLTANFDATRSSDPEGGALSYEWDFDGNGTVDSRSAKATYTYTEDRNYTAKLRVRDPRGAYGGASVVMYPGDNPPNKPTITSPAATKLFTVGERITLSGSATDPDGDPLTLNWTVRLNHNGTHTHPLFSGTDNNLAFTAPAPEDLAATSGSYLQIYLRATDPRGMYRTTYLRLNPKKVNVTFKTSNPAGLNVVVNGTTYDTTDSYGKTLVSWQGYNLNASAPTPQEGKSFYRWSDGATTTSRTITTPSGATTYTAQYR